VTPRIIATDLPPGMVPHAVGEGPVLGTDTLPPAAGASSLTRVHGAAAVGRADFQMLGVVWTKTLCSESPPPACLLWFRRDARSGNFGIDVCFKEEAVASCDDEVFIVGAVVVTLNPAVDIRIHHAVFRLKGWQYISPN
jgi:hypothetical protein